MWFKRYQKYKASDIKNTMLNILHKLKFTSLTFFNFETRHTTTLILLPVVDNVPRLALVL